MVKFVVLSTQRSGSTFLITSLDSHPQIQCYGEVFLHKSLNDLAYLTYRTASWQRQAAHWLRRKQLIDSYLTNLYTSANGIQALGFKLMYGQARKLPQVIEWLKDHEIRVLHCIRTNFLKTIVSRQVASTRGLYHSTKALAPIKVHLQPAQIKTEMIKIEQTIEKYRHEFANVPYLELTYESFVRHQDDETRRLLQFLDIETFVPLSTNRVKINPDSLMELIENYEEVAQALRGTPFERFLN